MIDFGVNQVDVIILNRLTVSVRVTVVQQQQAGFQQNLRRTEIDRSAENSLEAPVLETEENPNWVIYFLH